MNNRRDFLKNGIFASLALAIPIKPDKIDRITISKITNADAMIGVNGTERMRIFSNGNVGFGNIMPSYDLKIK